MLGKISLGLTFNTQPNTRSMTPHRAIVPKYALDTKVPGPFNYQCLRDPIINPMVNITVEPNSNKSKIYQGYASERNGI